jgi:hypothetical protein
MESNGWIKLHRKFLTWEWYGKSEMVHLFIHLLLSANHEDGKWRGVDIKRGQLVTGLHSLSKGTGLSIQTIRTSLKNLQKTGEINKRSNNQYSVITVCNYDSYNNTEMISNKQASKRLTSNQQATNNKQEYKNNKKYIYNAFYDSEIEKSENNPDYIKFVKVLFGNNSIGMPLESVLKMPQQMTFEQFKKLMYFKSKYRFNVSPILESMENNKKLSARKNVWFTFQTYMNNAHPETKNK